MCELSNLSREDMEDITTNNALKLFSI